MLRLKALILLLLAASFANGQPAVGRAILFVHGFCDTAVSWGSLETSVISYVTGLQPSLYTNPVPWTVYYDSNSQTVKVWPNGQDFLSTVPSSTRFFSIDFFDPSSTDFSSINPNNVAQVSILNKADELAHVIQAITALTLVKDVIVVAHSQGGLDARAYIENLAIPSSPISGGTCTDQNVYACFAEPRTYYTQDIAKLITLDTPHGGVELANWGSWINLPILECFLANTLDRRELEDSSFVIDTLTGSAGDPPSGLTIASIQSYTSPGFSAALGPDGDGVVTFQEQSIQNVVPSWANYYDVAPPDDFGSFFGFYGSVINIYPLHLLTIVGTQSLTTNTIEVELDKVLLHGSPAQTTSIAVQAASGVSYTLTGPTSLSGTGPNTFYTVPTGMYTLTYPGGTLQQTLGVDHSTSNNNWNLTFTIPSTSGAAAPTVLDDLTSSTTGIVNGVCNTPAQVTGFTVASPQVWMYFDLTGSHVGDSVQANFVRPDGVLYTTLSWSVSSVGQNGYQCFSGQIPVSGAAAASYPGTWAIKVFWDQASTPLFTLAFTLSASNSRVMVLDDLTSNTTGIVNGSCNIPPQVTSFTVTSPQLWLVFDVTGSQVGDSVQASFVRPDGVLYTALNWSVSSVGQNGYQCFSGQIPISGAAAASYPGTWAIKVFWDQANTPLFALNFTLLSATGSAPPTITSLSPSSVTAGGPSFTLTVNGSGFAAGAVVHWNGTTLPTNVVSATQLQASVSSSLIGSSGSASITVSSGGSVSSPFALTISPPSSLPTVAVGGVTNGASFAKGANGSGSAVAPGSLVSIFGTFPGATLATAATTPLPLSLGGVSVTFNSIPAPLSAVVPTGAFPLVNAQVPFEVLPAGQTSGTANVVVTVNGVPSLPQSIPIVAAAPGVFTLPPTGQGNAILAFLDPADNTAKIAAPAGAAASIGYPTAPIPVGQPGSFYATGLGAMTPPVADGAADLTITHFANATPTVMVGGVTAQVQFAGQAPGFPGVNQINIVIPNSAPTGNAVPLQIQTADGKVISTPGATIAIRAGSTQGPLPTLQSLTPPSTFVVGGGSTTETVTLSSSAPTGGALVTLSSNNSSAQVPSSVTVTSGQSSATFTITTTTVASTQTATITASLGTSTVWAVLTLSPGGSVSVSITEYPVPTSSSNPWGIATGSDGALWFGECNAPKIGRVTTAGVVAEYPSPGPGVGTCGIAAGSDGALWFTEYGIVSANRASNIGRITTGGVTSEYPIPSGNGASWITAGPDGALWFTEGVKIGRITTSGTTTEYSLPTPSALFTWDITAGPDGALWFTEYGTPKIGRITTAGVITEYPLPSSETGLNGIAAGPDGALWFTEYDTNKIGRITTSGIVTEFPIPTPTSKTSRITPGPDGALWFTECGADKIGRITTAGLISEYNLSASSYCPDGITTGPDGALWFTEVSPGDKIGRVALTTGSAPVLQALTLSTASASGGSSVTGTVTLSSPSPGGGIQVSLSSSNSSAQVPALVTIAAGQTSATFAITTTTVTSSQTATIAASFGGSTQTVVLTISPGSASLLGKNFTVDGTLNIGGQNIGIEIQAITAGGNVYLVTLEQLSNLFPIGIVLALDDITASGSGNTITFSGATVASVYTNGGTIVTINSATLTVTASGITSGSSATGTLSFPSPTGTIQGSITGTLSGVE